MNEIIVFVFDIEGFQTSCICICDNSKLCKRPSLSAPRRPCLTCVSCVGPLLLLDHLYVSKLDSLWKARLWDLGHYNALWQDRLWDISLWQSGLWNRQDWSSHVCHWNSFWEARLLDICHRDSLCSQTGLWNIWKWCSARFGWLDLWHFAVEIVFAHLDWVTLAFEITLGLDNWVSFDFEIKLGLDNWVTWKSSTRLLAASLTGTLWTDIPPGSLACILATVLSGFFFASSSSSLISFL